MMPAADHIPAVHPDWLHSMAPGLTDERLRSEIFADEACVRKLMAEHHPLLAFPDAKTEEQIERISDTVRKAISTENLRNIGLCWLAPRLVLCLFARETRSVCGDLTAEELLLVRAFHDHVDPATIPVIPDVEHIGREGIHCFLAWSQQFPGPVAEHLKLLVPPVAPEFSTSCEKRRHLFDRFLQVTSKDAAT